MQTVDVHMVLFIGSYKIWDSTRWRPTWRLPAQPSTSTCSPVTHPGLEKERLFVVSLWGRGGVKTSDLGLDCRHMKTENASPLPPTVRKSGQIWALPYCSSDVTRSRSLETWYRGPARTPTRSVASRTQLSISISIIGVVMGAQTIAQRLHSQQHRRFSHAL